MFVINADDLDIKFADIESEWQISGIINFYLDIEDRKIYWLTGDSMFYRGAYRMNLDGTNVEELLSVREGMGATFDFNTRKIYWVDSEGRQILWQTNLDGSGTEALFALGTGPKQIAVETGPIN